MTDRTVEATAEMSQLSYSTTKGMREVGTLPQPQNQCGFSLILRDRHQPGKLVAIRATCGTWGCNRCRPYLEARWTNHLTPLMGQHQQLYADAIPEDAWDAHRKALARKKASYVKVKQGKEIVVVATEQAGASFRVTPDIARQMLNLALQMVEGSRPVSTSRDWKLPPRPEPEDKRWEAVAASTAPVKAIAEAAQEVRPDDATTTTDDTAEFQTTADTLDTMREWLHPVLDRARTITLERMREPQPCPFCEHPVPPSMLMRSRFWGWAVGNRR